MRARYTQKCSNWPQGWTASADVVKMCEKNKPEGSVVIWKDQWVGAEWFVDNDPKCQAGGTLESPPPPSPISPTSPATTPIETPTTESTPAEYVKPLSTQTKPSTTPATPAVKKPTGGDTQTIIVAAVVATVLMATTFGFIFFFFL